MTHRLGISGSTILTDPNKFDQLFKYDLQHIEIGEFPNEQSLHDFLSLLLGKNISFALHSPLIRNQSKYDLLEKVHYPSDQAWKQFEAEVAHMSDLGAEYVLVHFPYFKMEINDTDVNHIIEEGLQRLSNLQDKYNIQLVCEPKLGVNRSAVGINYLDQFPIETWNRYRIKLCIDIGDYILATGEQAIKYISKWRDHIRVVHLHNIGFHHDKHIWIPIHPSHENDGIHYNIKDILEFLVTCNEVFFVFEHTQETNPTEELVAEGMQWLKEIISALTFRT